jgi:hypothetical protein
MRTSALVRLPESRVLQLKELAKKLSEDSMVSVLEGLIAKEWRRQFGHKPPPGFEVDAVSIGKGRRGVRIAHEGAGSVVLSQNEALKFGRALKRVLAGKQAGSIIAGVGDDPSSNPHVWVRSAGRGYSLQISNGEQVGLTKTLIAELAEMVQRAALANVVAMQ